MDFYTAFHTDSIKEELSMSLINEYKLNSHVRGYLAYITIWKYRFAPENELDKYTAALIKTSVVAGS